MEHNGRIKENIDVLREDVAKLRAEFSNITDRLLKVSRKAYASGNKKLGREASRLYDELGGGLDTARRIGGDKIGKVERRIAEKPFVSVLVAFLLGVLAGKLLDRE
jgi:ElaB/YqjD/DUF883 family membrane-anchored ribosome-binding protein